MIFPGVLALRSCQISHESQERLIHESSTDKLTSVGHKRAQDGTCKRRLLRQDSIARAGFCALPPSRKLCLLDIIQSSSHGGVDDTRHGVDFLGSPHELMLDRAVKGMLSPQTCRDLNET